MLNLMDRPMPMSKMGSRWAGPVLMSNLIEAQEVKGQISSHIRWAVHWEALSLTLTSLPWQVGSGAQPSDPAPLLPSTCCTWPV